MRSKILGPDEGPDEIDEKEGGNGAAGDEIEHHTRSQAGT
jgi:hypothetical protein